MRQRHRLQPNQEDDFRVGTQANLAQASEESARVFTWLLGSIASVSLLVGGIGIMNIMLVSVTERTREIGIRAALGARTGDVARTIARRSVTQLTVGILLGMPIAWRLLFELQRDLDRIQGQSPLLLALASGIGAMVVIGLIACVIPTRRALRIMPTEAFRSEI